MDHPATNLLTILLIDDDELDRKAIARVLRNSEFTCQIVEAGTAEEGLECAAQRSFDAIFLDYRLPDQDGLDVLRQLRSTVLYDVAVLMISRHEDETIAERSLEAGAQDFLLKEEVNATRLSRALKQARQRYLIEEDLRRSREQLRDLSEHDPLTGLLNRRGFEQALNAAIHSAQRRDGHIAILLLDLDDFKSINDTLGHDVGDLLLKKVAVRLNSVIRESDKLCRLGGDEFIIIMQDYGQDEQPLLLANRIFHILQVPIFFGSSQHNITASVGIAVLGDSDEQDMDLLKCADLAMYQAKRNGRNRSHFYAPALQHAAESKARIKKDLNNAIQNNEFKVYYQTQVNSRTGVVDGMEALIRWQHPDQGLLTPAAFLPVAEESTMIIEIGEWVLRNACKQMQTWKRKYPKQCQNLSISVNLSAVQIHEKNIYKKIEKILHEQNIPPHQLELEITESALIADPSATVVILEKIEKMGVKLSLDDFGTGYSSLDHLRLFPISVLKIDKGFIDGIGKDKKSENLLKAIIAFGKTLEMKIVAEGIETKQQSDFCTAQGCDLLQGYFHSKPISAEDIEATVFTRETEKTHT